MTVAYVDSLPSTSQVPGVRTLLASPPPQAPLGPADEVGLIGTADRGPVYSPLYVAARDFPSTFGGMVANALFPGQPLTLYPDYEGVTSNGVQDVCCQRVMDATGRTAYVTVMAGAAQLFSLVAATPGTWANGMIGSIQNIDTVNQTFDMTITNLLYGQADVLRKIPYGNYAAMIKAINVGIPNVSPAAKLVVATPPMQDAPVPGAVVKNLAVGGTLPAGTYRALLLYYGASYAAPFGVNGFTEASVETAPVTIALGDTLTFSVPPQSWASGFMVYLTPPNGAPGSEYYAGSFSAMTGTIIAPPAANTSQPSPAPNLANQGLAAQPTTLSFAFQATGAARSTGMAFGTNGDNPSTAQHIGVQGLPDTGIYRMGAVIPSIQLMSLCGPAGTDPTGWDECARVARINNWQHVASVALGTSDSAAIALMQTTALQTLRGTKQADFIKFAYGGLKWYDDKLYNIDLTLPAQADFAGITAATRPNTAAGNKPLGRGDDTESTISDETRLGALWSVGLNPLINNIPAGGLGFMRDTMFSGRESFEMRLAMLVVDDTNAVLGRYAQEPNDPSLWATIQQVVQARMDARADAGIFPQNPEGGFTGATAIGAGTGGSAGATAATTTGKTKGAGGSTLPSAVTAGTATGATGGVGYSVECNARTNIVNGQITDRVRVEIRLKPYPNTVGVDVAVQAGVNIPDITTAQAA